MANLSVLPPEVVLSILVDMISSSPNVAKAFIVCGSISSTYRELCRHPYALEHIFAKISIESRQSLIRCITSNHLRGESWIPAWLLHMARPGPIRYLFPRSCILESTRNNNHILLASILHQMPQEALSEWIGMPLCFAEINENDITIYTILASLPKDILRKIPYHAAGKARPLLMRTIMQQFRAEIDQSDVDLALSQYHHVSSYLREPRLSKLHQCLEYLQ